MFARNGLSRTNVSLDQRKIILQALLVFAALISIYTLTYSGIPRVEDEQFIAARAQSLVQWGQLNYPQLSGNDRIRHSALIDTPEADFNAAGEPGQVILAAFFHWLAMKLSAGGTLGAMAANLYITALTGAGLYLLLISMSYRPKVACAVALLFGLGTIAWPYSKTLFRDVLLMFFTVITAAGFWLSIHGTRRETRSGFALLTLGIAGAVLTKRTGWVLAPSVLAGYTVNWDAMMSRERQRRWILCIVAISIVLVSMAFLMIPSTGALARFNAEHFLFVLQRSWEGIGSETLPAMLGPFLSPGRSVFLYSPFLLLAPVGLMIRWKTNRPFSAFALSAILLLVTAQALFYREAWAGIPIWGLRFMLMTMPLMTVFTAPVIENAFRGRGGVLRWLLPGLGAVSIVFQFAGATVSWHTTLLRWSRTGWDAYAPGAIWHLASLAVPIHLGELLHGRSLDLAWVRVMDSARFVVLIPIFVSGLAAACIWHLSHTFQATGLTKKSLIIAGVLVAFGLVVPVFPTLRSYADDPVVGGGVASYSEMLEWLAPKLEFGDLVIMDSYGTPLWHFMMNHWSIPLHWYSLPYAPSRTPEHNEQVVNEIIQSRAGGVKRVWILRGAETIEHASSDGLPDELILNATIRFEGDSPVSVERYRNED